MLKAIYAQETAKEAHAQWKTVADTLGDRALKLAAPTNGACEDVPACIAFPNEHWPQITGTNPLEGLNGGGRRRSVVVGIFLDDRAIVRLVGALVLEHNDEWAPSRCYMSLGGLAAVSRLPVVRLPAITV